MHAPVADASVQHAPQAIYIGSADANGQIPLLNFIISRAVVAAKLVSMCFEFRPRPVMAALFEIGHWPWLDADIQSVS